MKRGCTVAQMLMIDANDAYPVAVLDTYFRLMASINFWLLYSTFRRHI
jgi:hypothetical protein